MEMNKRLEYILEKAQSLDYKVEQEDGIVYSLRTFSPFGQDCYAEIDSENDAEMFINNLRNYADNFDVSYEAYLWLDETGHGKNGAPYDMRDVYEDMEWWKNAMTELAYTLEKALEEYDNKRRKNK